MSALQDSQLLVWLSGSVAAPMQGAWWMPMKASNPMATRTGGPDDDDDDDDLRWLMPILAVVVIVATVFG